TVWWPERTSVPGPDLPRFPLPPIALGTVNRSLRLNAMVAPPTTETLPPLGLPLVPPLPKATEPELICTAPDPVMLLVTTAPSDRLNTSTPLLVIGPVPMLPLVVPAPICTVPPASTEIAP